MTHSDFSIISVYKKQTPARKPVWFMRQAGRYLPEYQAIRKKHSMLEAIQTPELAAEITLQPLRRFDLDAAIIFADILNPLIGLGIKLDFIEKEGPKIFNPITSNQDVLNLIDADPLETISYTLEAIKKVKAELLPRSVPVLGFSGAPFTLSTYLIEGKTSHSLTHVKRFIGEHPDSWNLLQQKLKKFTVRYLCAQASAGVSAVQLFDSWAGYVSPFFYERYVLPTLIELVNEFKEKSDIPIIYFSTGTSGMIPLLKKIPVDGFSIDWRMPLSKASDAFGNDTVLQGNLDPELIGGDNALLKDEVSKILTDASSLKHHIFNLGHGILPHTPIANVESVIDLVRRG
jgi:uroporphyrinogen decarboxylase